MGEVIVRCEGVVKNYGSGETMVRALRGIDLEVRAGELLMLVGPSGCGKTTLLSVIAAILESNEGTCYVLGKQLEKLSEHERVRLRGHGVGFVFQSFHLIPALTAEENVAIPLLIQQVPRAEAMKRAKKLLKQVGLGHRRKAFPVELSGGERQRVAVCRAIVHEPPLVVCDEPTSALDHKTGEQVMEVLQQLVRGEDRALIVVTHDQRIFNYADRIAEMDDGVVVK